MKVIRFPDNSEATKVHLGLAARAAGESETKAEEPAEEIWRTTEYPR
jgi:hypothetical protein